MRTRFSRPLLAAAFACVSTVALDAQVDLAEMLAEPGTDLTDPESRRQIAERARLLGEQRRQAAREKAAERGLPLRIVRPDGALQEIADFIGDEPLYHTTHNANASISTGATEVRGTYAVDGGGVVIGMWDGGAGRASHQEFGGRLVVKDGAPSINHATHVGGTLAAAGVVSSAKGMATAAIVDSYDWNSDIAEMTARGAAAPGEAGTIYLSNHSYGFVAGWNYVNNGTRVWEWYGNGTGSTGFEQDFGRYNTYSRDQDALAFNAPYYLIFRSAGNDRTDNPASGQNVALSPGSSTVVSYDPTLHPAGDGSYRGGFETISFAALAKNVVTVGSITDAVTSGQRDPLKAKASSFSSWGPTDDGRIKPDLVANGDGVYSSLNGSNTAYGSFSGTSMSSPNAAGTAALLIHHHANLFPGQAMRASTLKGLLIHTADDIGNPGPDYKFGWGLIDGGRAAALLADHHAYPDKQRITESQLTSSTITETHPFVWDGVSPIRATLGWTDPAGSATTTSDLRSPRLVNDLDLKLIAPGGTEHFPYVMPFVGTWTQASMNSAAVTGVNRTDNVEQVFVAAPAAAGTWQAVVTFSGTLTNNSQQYSLLLSGSSAEPPPPPPLSVTSVSPASGLAGPVTIDLSGTGFKTDTSVTFTRAGQNDIPASDVQLISGSLRCQFDLSGAAAGSWDLLVANSDGESLTVPAAFSVTGALWSETFDGTISGWSSQAVTGTNVWSPTTATSHSPPTSYFAPGPSAKSTVNLTSPTIQIPDGASDLQLRFWHRYNLQSSRDGGRLEFSLNGGAWFDVTASGSGAAFASNGYNGTIAATGRPQSRSDFAGLEAWTGSSNGFIETIINLSDTVKYAGQSLRARWRLATDDGTSSPGWHIDTISLIGDADVANQPPAIVSPATGDSGETETDPIDGTIYHIVRGITLGLSVTASDDGGESALTYTWETAESPGIPAFFSPNGGNAAKSTVASFETAGDYLLSVSVTDAQGLTTTSQIHIRVVPTASELRVDPATASLAVGGGQSFGATAIDQFGDPLATQPSSFTWSSSGGGTIDASGSFTATDAGGPFVISAESGELSGTAQMTVLPGSAEITLTNLAQTYDGSPKPVTATTTPAGLTVEILYAGSASAPSDVGNYPVEATVTDPNYQGSAVATLEITGTTFDSWAAASFDSEQQLAGLAAATADADGDGLKNLAEYALGTDPNSFTFPPRPVLEGNVLSLEFEHPIDRSDVTCSVEVSTDLVIWTTVPLTTVSESDNTRVLRAEVAQPADEASAFFRFRFDL